MVAIGRNEHCDSRVKDAVTQRTGGEPPEDDGVDRAQARHGQQRGHLLGDGGHVDRHAIALVHAQILQGFGHAIGQHIQVMVGQRARRAVVTLPIESDFVAGGRVHIPVEAVVRNIEFPIGEPLEEGLVGPFERLVPGLEPVQFLRHIFPELEAVVQGPLEKRLVVVKALRLHVGGDVRLLHHLGWGGEHAFLGQNSVGVFKSKAAHRLVSSLSNLL